MHTSERVNTVNILFYHVAEPVQYTIGQFSDHNLLQNPKENLVATNTFFSAEVHQNLVKLLILNLYTSSFTLFFACSNNSTNHNRNHKIANSLRIVYPLSNACHTHILIACPWLAFGSQIYGTVRKEGQEARSVIYRPNLKIS